MTLKTYILAVLAISAIAFGLLLMSERDTALIFFGILAGFFTNILSIDKTEKVEEGNDELESILSNMKEDENISSNRA